MNLEESDLFKKELEKNNRNKKSVIISIIFCGLLIVLLIAMIAVIKHKDSITEKMFLNDKQIDIPTGFYKNVDGKIYVNVKQMASLLGYTYTKGEYNKFNEDKESCYLQNDFEIIAITAGRDYYTKYIELSPASKIDTLEVTSKNKNGYNESFKIEIPVKYEDEALYILADYLPNMFNMQVSWEQYRINFYSLDYIIKAAQKIIANYKITEMSGYYENLRAIPHGYVIIGNATEKEKSDLYGVMSLATGKEVISVKYDDIVYIQNSKEFYITAANGTVGILDSEGGTVIAPSEYEEITLLDQDNKLYLVRKGNEYGVLDRNGKVVVYAENDKIGIDSTKFTAGEVENSYVLFDKCIPVEKDKKYGLYNINGDVVLDSVYDGFGYISKENNTSTGTEKSVLLIPSEVGINGIVVNYDDLYGIYDVNAERLIYPAVFEKIYYITKNNETTYYAEYGGERINLADKIKEDNLVNIELPNQKLNEEEQTQEVSGEEQQHENTVVE